MTRKNIISNTILSASLLTFIAFVIYILYINQEVLYTASDRSEFLFGTPFFHTLMQKPFGLIQYMGAWLTQLFCIPAIGAGVLIVIWALIFIVGMKAFRLKGSATALMLLPIACLLLAIVDLGYWIYVSPIRGYWFSQSIGYLLMVLLLWAARSTSRKWHFLWYLFVFCIYPVLGWFALLFVICLALAEKPTWRELVGLVVLVFTASIWHTQFYSNLKFDDVVLAGLPRFVTASDKTDHLSMPFYVLGAVSVLISWYGRNLNKLFAPMLCAFAGIIFISSLKYQDQNYLDEMRMVRLATDDNWKEVLQMAKDNKKPTITMLFLKNIALMNEGGLLDRSFKVGNNAVSLNNPDTVHVSLLDIASPLVYYNYGMINEGIRLCFENGIQAGFSPFYLKMLSRCELANGNKKLVKRYTTLLNHLPLNDNWQPAPVSAKIKELMKSYPDELTGIENSDSYVINSISLWTESDSKIASEQALFYSMMRCDSHRFWTALRNYVKVHMNEEFPLHAQEAYILYLDKAPEEKRMMMPVEQSVYDDYKQFWADLESQAKPGMTPERVADVMRMKWGETYWFYNLFGRKFY